MSTPRRRTADDFVRDMKAKQQHSAPDIENKTSEGQTPTQAGERRRTPVDSRQKENAA
jgi:hypothetical protein